MKTQQTLIKEMAQCYLQGDMEQFYKTEQRIERMDTKEDNKRIHKEEEEK